MHLLMLQIKDEGEDARHDVVAIQEDHLTPGRMFSNSKVYRGGKAFSGEHTPIGKRPAQQHS